MTVKIFKNAGKLVLKGVNSIVKALYVRKKNEKKPHSITYKYLVSSWCCMYYAVKAPIKGVLDNHAFFIRTLLGGGNFCRYQTTTRNL